LTTSPTGAEPLAVVFDRHRLFRDAVESILNARGITIAAKATSADDAIAQIEAHGADLLIVGLAQASESDGAAALIRRAIAGRPGLNVIVLSGADADVAGKIFDAGAAAFISKSGSHEDIGFAIRQTYKPSIHFAPRKAAETPAAAETSLTERELEILRLVAKGRSNAEVASALWVTEQTVKFHLSNVFRKLGVSNRTQASRKAHELNLIAADGSDVEASVLLSS
jgi:DNA-binding NarL/FixJ family response regulator